MREAAGSTGVADFGEEGLGRKTEVPTYKEGLDHLHSPRRKRGVSTPAPPLSLMDRQSGDSVERATVEGWPGAQISP